ncbi:nicotinate-nucleotide--dimethylbenzimidazole phosphoribosyltransferase [Vreelandella utahensis]|uniref:nicotinate-nucleotide--dimethylbenzimidazole phosphoribosyltransferase n=1 Tax=Vreelandella halophila TaxID=86177 RepID=UPI0009844271|nr:nicotinate-nucleotide--dimethylbenzimidazole phosphoribosyltransferase [Halomonas utahensis]
MTDPFWQQPLPHPSRAHHDRAVARQQQLTKPPGSLGQLEALACHLCAQQNRDRPAVDRVHIAVFAGDHGIAADGVSAFPQEVTAQMVANFAAGGAAISVLARQLGATLEVINMGVAHPLPDDRGVINEWIAPGTRNLMQETAMSVEQLEQALEAGDRAAGRASEAGAELFIGGDMGIGNTTSASALASLLLGTRVEELVGPGTGLDELGVARKARRIRAALQRHGSDTDPFNALASLGGFEIAALAGAMIGSAHRGIPVLVDGFIVTAAALVATHLSPNLMQWLHFSHQSREPGHRTMLEAMGATAVLDLDMRLGEGSGAAVAVPVLRSACALHNEMATFTEAGVTDG